MSLEKKFKLNNRQPACNKRPWEYLVPKEIRADLLMRVRQECLEIYGNSLSECTKKSICFTKKCLGRELEWKSKLAKPYLDMFAKIVGINEGDLYYIQNDCAGCPIAKECKSPCYQVNDYLNRFKTKEPNLVYQENLENHNPIEYYPETIANVLVNKEVPWDCLTDRKQELVRKYLYEGKDFLTIAKEMDLNNQARVKYEFYSALNKLSEFAKMREFIKEYEQILRNENPNQYEILKELYINNLTTVDVAEKKGISKQAVGQTLTRVLTRYKISFMTFVKKVGNKVVYNVPEVFK
jgi:predicted DNA-binding protein YlxM (UPF0122 family)